MRQLILWVLLVGLSGIGFEFIIVSEIPLQNGFDGFSDCDLRLFSPPNRFWRVISEHKFISQTEEAVSNQKILF